MASWRIEHIVFGYIEQPPSLYHEETDAYWDFKEYLGDNKNAEFGKVPCAVFLLINDETNEVIMVDCGFAINEEWGKKYHNPRYMQSEDQSMEKMLAKYDLTADDIKTIVITHSHWDHAMALNRMKNAKIYIQEEDITGAILSPWNYKGHASRSGAEIPGEVPYCIQAYHQLEVIDGDYDLRPGIKILKFGGHTPGMQGLLVDGENGKRYLLCGDLVMNRRDFENGVKHHLCSNNDELEAGMVRAKALVEQGVILIAAHDTEKLVQESLNR